MIAITEKGDVSVQRIKPYVATTLFLLTKTFCEL